MKQLTQALLAISALFSISACETVDDHDDDDVRRTTTTTQQTTVRQPAVGGTTETYTTQTY